MPEGQRPIALMLAALFDIPPGSAGWESFQFQHLSDHDDIITAIQTKLQIQMVVRPLYPLNLDDQQAVDNWLELHQQSHTDFDSILGIVGNDLTSVDFKKPNEVKAWIWLNAQEHQNARQILGI